MLADQMAPNDQQFLNRLESAGASRGFVLLSNAAPNERSLISYRCPRGHTVSVRRTTALSGRWAGHCDECMYEDRLMKLIQLTKERGGKIISTKRHFTTTEKVTIECAEGHRSKKAVYNLLEGSWCARCHLANFPERLKSDGMASKKRSKQPMFERIAETAKAHGGRCLSTEYKNLRSHLEWECSKGHRWKGPAQSVLYNGAWCNVCSLQARPKGITIETLHEFARSHGGELLSEDYRRNDIKLSWRCSEGHKFQRAWISMRRVKAFCPKCRE